MQSYTLEIRSISLKDIQAYLEELGGEMQPSGRIHGLGWQACLSPMEDYLIGSLRFEQVRLEWNGNEEAIKSVWLPLQQKIIRPGG
ncbi:MAG: hypothetical protein ABFC94_17145 [Syntrophomonas sp.]